MTAKSDKQPVPASDASLDAIAWVRGVRDAMYADTSTLSAADFIRYVRRAARAVDADEQPSGPRSGAGPA